MKKITLTRGMYALIDDDVFDDINQYKWHVMKCGSDKNTTWYAVRSLWIKAEHRYKTVIMHRAIWELKRGVIPEKHVIDHKNHDGLDNQVENIRCVEPKHNQRNQRIQINPEKHSVYKGVSWLKNLKKWEAYITTGDKKDRIGCFSSEIDAAEAYNKEAIARFGEFAYLNKISVV